MHIDPHILLTSIIDASVDGIFAFDGDLVVIAWNTSMERLTGVSRQVALGQSASTLFPSLADSGEEKQLRAALEGKNAVRENNSSLGKAGSFNHHYSPLRNHDGSVAGGVCIIREIGAARDDEEANDDVSQRLAFHVENSPLAVIEWSNDFRVSHWSEAAERLFGWTAEEVIGKHVSDWEFVFAEDLDAVARVTYRQRMGAEIHGVQRNRNYTKDGSILFCEWYNSVLHDDQGRLVSVLSLVLDVTSRKLAEEERAALLVREREARRHAEEADRLKDEFLATLSHELRTPLTSILGWSSMIRSGEVEQKNVARAIETIERNARSQARLIDDLLDVSRIITGNLRLELHPLNIAPILEAGLDALRPTADAKGIQLSQDFASGGDFLVRGDSNRLRQVIWNLVSNAIKFTPRGGTVDVDLARVDGSIRLTVSDTGEGIPAEFLPYVFDRFRQAEGSISRRQGGLGLGLAVVRHLVELHGGNVSAESAGRNLGSTFTVDLPVAVERRDPARAEERKREIERRRNVHADVIRLDGVFVMVVEDDDDSRSLVGTMLERHGATVVFASSSKQALSTLQHLMDHGQAAGVSANRLPDVLISDIGMPDEDGYELLLKLRALPSDQGGQIPAIALTGYATRKDRERALSVGYQLHLAKPVEQSDLLSAITTLVGRRDVVSPPLTDRNAAH